MILQKSKIYFRNLFENTTTSFSENFSFIKRRRVIVSENKKIFIFLEIKNNFLSSSEGNFLINYYIKTGNREGIDFRRNFSDNIEIYFMENASFYKNHALFCYFLLLKSFGYLWKVKILALSLRRKIKKLYKI